MDENYLIRTMSLEELEMAIEWAALEGWNPGLYDAQSFYQADPQGFLVGLLNDEPIATISAVKYGDSFGFLGFYIVKPEYRGKGYGIKIWRAALDYLSNRTIGLDGVLAQQSNYQKSGFQLAYRNIRYQLIKNNSYTVDDEVINLLSLPFDIVNNFDRLFFPDDRTSFWQSWIHQPETRAVGIVREGNIVAVGVIRTCREGYKIGPLLAENLALAELIFSALISEVEQGEPVYLDIPEVNPQAQRLVQNHQMSMVFETARMYKGEMPDLPTDKIFGVTSFELG